jgi:hypothetical protein
MKRLVVALALFIVSAATLQAADYQDIHSTQWGTSHRDRGAYRGL